jgi:predicted LPLAT superfamily acyltransferase
MSGNEVLSAAIVLILATTITLAVLFNTNFFIQMIVVAVFFVVGTSARAPAFLFIRRKEGRLLHRCRRYRLLVCLSDTGLGRLISSNPKGNSHAARLRRVRSRALLSRQECATWD